MLIQSRLREFTKYGLVGRFKVCVLEVYMSFDGHFLMV